LGFTNIQVIVANTIVKKILTGQAHMATLEYLQQA